MTGSCSPRPHPLARSSTPQYSSAVHLQGLETFLQPTSSELSPQSSSPLHRSVLGIQRPERNRTPVEQRLGRSGEPRSGPTCASTQEALTHRDAVAGVSGRDGAGLLLPAVEIAGLPPKLRRLLQRSVAILWEKHMAGQRRGGAAVITLASVPTLSCPGY